MLASSKIIPDHGPSYTYCTLILAQSPVMVPSWAREIAPFQSLMPRKAQKHHPAQLAEAKSDNWSIQLSIVYNDWQRFPEVQEEGFSNLIW